MSKIYKLHMKKNSPKETIFIFRILFQAFLSIDFTKYYKEMVTFITFDKSCRTNKGFYMSTRISALGTRESGRFLSASPVSSRSSSTACVRWC